MRTKAITVAMSILLLVFKGYCSHVEAAGNNYTYEDNEGMARDPLIHAQLSDIRLLHEGAIFLLKRYATLEALITAVEIGRSENEGFWIGAASAIPGAGQMINRDYLQGSLLLFASTLSWGTVQQLEFTRARKTGDESMLPLYYSSLVLRNGIMTYAMLHATNASYREHHDRTMAMWTGAASLLPGTGQAINGDWWEAAGLFVAWGLSAALVTYFETALFEVGDEGYLVESPQAPEWDVSWVPGGATLSVTVGW